jgi:Aspartyl protease
MGFAARTGMLFALLLTELGVSRNQNDVVRLLERMSNASGPVWTAHFVSVSRLTFDGEPAVVVSESEGLRTALRHCTGELCDGTYFDGERLFTVNLNGTTLPESAAPQPYLRSLRLVASLAFLAPSFLTHGGRFGNAGSTTLNGHAYRTIVVGDADSIPMRVYVDPSTSLVRYAREFGGSDTFEFRDYRRVGAFTLPFEVLHDGQLFERYDDRAAVSSAFHPPHGLLPTLHGAPSAIAIDSKAAEPIVDCTVGGIALRCLIDTGNSGLSMSAELASRLGAPVVGSYQVRGLGGYSTQVVRAGPLHVGNAVYSDAYYVVLNDLRRYGYDVVLGADLFGATDVVLDLAAHLVTLGEPLAQHSIDIPISFQHSVPVVRVRLGSLDTDLAVDTGDESNINLAYDFYAKHPGLFTVTSRRFVSGIGGSSVELIGEIGDVTIGEYRAGPQRIGTTWTLHGTASGHLGAAFWQQFTVGLDYANGEMHLIPRRT